MSIAFSTVLFILSGGSYLMNYLYLSTFFLGASMLGFYNYIITLLREEYLIRKHFNGRF